MTKFINLIPNPAAAGIIYNVKGFKSWRLLNFSATILNGGLTPYGLLLRMTDPANPADIRLAAITPIASGLGAGLANLSIAGNHATVADPVLGADHTTGHLPDVWHTTDLSITVVFTSTNTQTFSQAGLIIEFRD